MPWKWRGSAARRSRPTAATTWSARPLISCSSEPSTDMFGWFTRRHEDKLRFGNTERTQIMYLLPEDPREYLDPLSREEVNRRVEWLLEKFGLVRELFLGTARHTVGTGLV